MLFEVCVSNHLLDSREHYTFLEVLLMSLFLNATPSIEIVQKAMVGKTLYSWKSLSIIRPSVSKNCACFSLQVCLQQTYLAVTNTSSYFFQKKRVFLLL